jgi:glutamine synthetase
MSDAGKKTIHKMIEAHNVKFVDLRFTDTRGKEQHITITTDFITADFFKEGKMFDGSSISGWKSINISDLILIPEFDNAFIDPFFEEATLVLRCDIYDPTTMAPYERDPRSAAKRAAKYLRSTGIADICNFGPEPEFFIFDDVRWKISIDRVFFRLDSKEAAWNSETQYEEGNVGHRPGIKGGYFPVPPVDSSQDLRSAMCSILKDLGISVETHHHEVATANQCEIDMKYSDLLSKADHMILLKYVVHNVANAYGKTATFMPKPLVGDNGSGMHCHQSLFKGGKNLFAGNKYAGLSELALFYIGGIIKHAKSLNAFTNPTTNSYKRLVPGFEAPVNLAYSALNRSAAIRVPYSPNAKGKRIEVRFPDPACNPYLAFSAMLMAGLDGIENKIHPGDAIDKNLYLLESGEAQKIPSVCGTLQEALDNLKKDHDYLLKGKVFNDDLLAGYYELKQQEVNYLNTTTHPVEFEMYYSE